MATSQLALRLRSERCSLLSRLIGTLLDTQPGDDDHELALEFCTHHTHAHGFLDTNPATVDEEYCGCGAAVHTRCRCLYHWALCDTRLFLAAEHQATLSMQAALWLAPKRSYAPGTALLTVPVCLDRGCNCYMLYTTK